MKKVTTEQAQATLLEAAKGIILVANPIGNATYIFEKEYKGMFKVHGHRLEALQNAINDIEGDN